MVLDVGCEFRDQGSILSEHQRLHDIDFEQVNFTITSVASSLAITIYKGDLRQLVKTNCKPLYIIG